MYNMFLKMHLFVFIHLSLPIYSFQDIESPNIICPEDQPVQIQDKPMITLVWDEPGAADNSGNVSVVACDKQAGTNYTIGLIKVTCIAIDGSNNAATCRFQINITGKHNSLFQESQLGAFCP